MMRLACALLLGSQLVLLGLALRPSGASAIAASFVGAPLLAAGALSAVLWLLRTRGEEER